MPWQFLGFPLRRGWISKPDRAAAGPPVFKMAKNTRKFEFTLGRTGLISFILGMGALVFVFFLLGMKTGAYLDTYPEKLASWPVALVRALGLDPESKRAAEEEAALTAAKSLPAAEVAAIPKEPDKHPAHSDSEPATKDESIPDKNPVTETALPPPPAETITPPVVIPPVAPRKEVAVPQLPQEKIEAAKPNSEPAGKYLIQVVAFREMEKAMRFRREIARFGYKPEVETIEQAEAGTWHRVVIRNFKSADEARKAISRLNAKFKGLNCVVRSDDQLNN